MRTRDEASLLLMTIVVYVPFSEFMAVPVRGGKKGISSGGTMENRRKQLSDGSHSFLRQELSTSEDKIQKIRHSALYFQQAVRFGRKIRVLASNILQSAFLNHHAELDIP